MYENILVDRDERMATVTVNRPEKLNALNKATLGELLSAFEGIAADRQTGGVILTGAREKAFVAGADIAELEKRLLAASSKRRDEAASSWLTTSDAATLLGVSPKTVVRYVDQGKFQSNGLRGRARRINPASLGAYRAAQQAMPRSEAQVRRRAKSVRKT